MRGTFKATLQSEKNALTDRLKRIDENLRGVTRVDSTLDRNHMKGTLLPEMFKPFELRINTADRNLNVTEELVTPLEKQHTTLVENLEPLEDQTRKVAKERDAAHKLLCENLPKMSIAVPPANSFETTTRNENEKRYFSLLDESVDLSIKTAKMRAKQTQISKCLDSSKELVVKMRTKRSQRDGSETNRKSYYNVPRVKLFGGSLVEYIRESGQPIPRIITRKRVFILNNNVRFSV